MNYYEHHLGDYTAATAHLSWDEDAAYHRLLCAYYHHERPIPADIAAACRISRAATPAQRKAVQSVLNEFFALAEDGWHQPRCDAEIERYRDKQTKAKRSANARWKQCEKHTDGNANASHDAMRTHSEGNALQTPDTRPNTKNQGGDYSTAVAPVKADTPPFDASEIPDNPTDDPPPRPTNAGMACLALRAAGCTGVNPSHPDLLALLTAGVTPGDLGNTAAECVAAGKPAAAYVIRTHAGRIRDAADRASSPTPARTQAQSMTVPSDAAAKTAAYLAAQADRGATPPPPGIRDKLLAMARGAA